MFEQNRWWGTKVSISMVQLLSPTPTTQTRSARVTKNHNTVASGGHPNTTQLIHAVILPAAGSLIQEILSIFSCETTVQILLTVCLFAKKIAGNNF